MAGAMSYIHAVIPVNISRLYAAIQKTSATSSRSRLDISATIEPTRRGAEAKPPWIRVSTLGSTSCCAVWSRILVTSTIASPASVPHCLVSMRLHPSPWPHLITIALRRASHLCSWEVFLELPCVCTTEGNSITCLISWAPCTGFNTSYSRYKGRRSIFSLEPKKSG